MSDHWINQAIYNNGDRAFGQRADVGSIAVSGQSLMKKVAALAVLFLALMPLRAGAQILMSGTFYYSAVGNVVTYGVDRVTNYRPYYTTSGTLAIQGWATSAPYYGGGSLVGYKLVESPIGTLQGGYYFANVIRTQTITSLPPPGYYYIVFVLAEWNGSQYLTVDYGNFPAIQPIGVVAPSILTPPQSYSVTVGQAVSLTVSASGTAPLYYQWRKNGVTISGATGSTLSFGSAQTTDTGSYTVEVSNGAGAVTSAAANLTVTAVAPVITSNPISQAVTGGTSVSFSVTATGTPPLSYQWRKNGTAITSAVGSNYTIPNAQAGDAATYTVFVSNAAGSVLSSGAILTVSAARPTFTAPSWNRTNGFDQVVNIQPGFSYRVQVSTNFSVWSDLTNFTAVGSSIQIRDAPATNLTRRFYRVVSP
jgi:hypothetical protein